MKVTPGMVEAGVAAMARAKRGRPTDEALVAAIFSAMRSMEVTESKQASAPEKTYTHQSYPAWRFGPDGESQIFERAEDVPEGWSAEPQSQEVYALQRDAHTLEPVIPVLKKRGRPAKAEA